VGNGASSDAVQRDTSAAAFRIVTVDANTTCKISGLEMIYGKVNGGDIKNLGYLTLLNDIVGYGQAAGFGGKGGGIANEQNATLEVDNCIVSNNTSGDRGGGVYNNGLATFDQGGGINQNTAGSSGGGFFNDPNGTLRLIGGESVSYNNTGTGGAGGGIDNLGAFSMTGGQIDHNHAYSLNGVGGKGGGLMNASGTATLTNVSITNNTAWKGGGLYVATGTTTNLSHDTFTANSAAILGSGIAYQDVRPDTSTCDMGPGQDVTKDLNPS
jgi:hypothetical protein